MRPRLVLLGLLAVSGCSLFSSSANWDAFSTCVETCLTQPQPMSAAQCAAQCAGSLPTDVKHARQTTLGQSSPQ